jgi:hypothetical protein
LVGIGKGLELFSQQNIVAGSIGEDEVELWIGWVLALQNVLDDLVEWGDTSSSSNHGVGGACEFSFFSSAKYWVKIILISRISYKLKCPFPL